MQLKMYLFLKSGKIHLEMYYHGEAVIMISATPMNYAPPICPLTALPV